MPHIGIREIAEEAEYYEALLPRVASNVLHSASGSPNPNFGRFSLGALEARCNSDTFLSAGNAERYPTSGPLSCKYLKYGITTYLTLGLKVVFTYRTKY